MRHPSLVSAPLFALIVAVALARAAPTSIYVWGDPDCPACQATKNYLESKGAPYVFIDALSAGSKFTELVGKLGYDPAVPTIVYVYPDGTASVAQGFSETDVDDALSRNTGGVDYAHRRGLPAELQKLARNMSVEAAFSAPLAQPPPRSQPTGGIGATSDRLDALRNFAAEVFGAPSCVQCNQVLATLYVAGVPFKAVTVEDPDTKDVFESLCSALGVDRDIPLILLTSGTVLYVIQGAIDADTLASLPTMQPSLIVNGRVVRSLSHDEQVKIARIATGRGQTGEGSGQAGEPGLPVAHLVILILVAAVAFSVYYYARRRLSIRRSGGTAPAV